jgi:predicted RNase H-like HicB family nuclease
MDTEEAALAELINVFGMISEEYLEKGLTLPQTPQRLDE